VRSTTRRSVKPTVIRLFTASTNLGIVRVDLRPNGGLYLISTITGITWISLDSIFYAFRKTDKIGNSGARSFFPLSIILFIVDINLDLYYQK
jgi:hypothetical protein